MYSNNAIEQMFSLKVFNKRVNEIITFNYDDGQTRKS
jgi:hypothetical protein